MRSRRREIESRQQDDKSREWNIVRGYSGKEFLTERGVGRVIGRQ